MGKAYYELNDGKSHKFWDIETKGSTVTVHSGKIDTDGQTTVKKLGSSAAAAAHAKRVTQEKVKKGYKKIHLAITPVNTNSFVKEVIYKKGRQSFSVLSVWKNCTLIAEKVPRTKLIEGERITRFTSVEFQKGAQNYKKTLVLPDNLCDADKRLIRRRFRNTDLWLLSDDGWELSRTVHTLKGEFSVIKVPVHKITLFTGEVELVHKPLSKAEFANYAANGMPTDEYYDSVNETLLIFDERTSLSVDEEEISGFYDRFKFKYDLAMMNAGLASSRAKKKSVGKKEKKIQYAAIGESWIKRSWYDLTIYEEFEFDKLDVSVSREHVFGTGDYHDGFWITYAGQDLEFRENWGSNYTEYCLIDSNGKKTELELLDQNDEADADADEDEDDDDAD